jgi:hypothetical protein
MSIVEDVGAPGEPTPQPVLGWLIAIGLPLAQMAFGIALAIRTSSHASATAAAQHASFSWDSSLGALAPVFAIVLVLDIIFIPGAFGFRRRQLIPFLPRGRWLIVGAFLALALAVDWYLVSAGERGGFAEPAGAGWTQNGVVVARHDWSQATSRRISCTMTGRHGDTPSLNYLVGFADGRRAQLTEGLYGDSTGDHVRSWLARIAPIDQQLNAAPLAQSPDFERRGRVDNACLARYTEHLTPDEDGAFRRILRLPPPGSK